MKYLYVDNIRDSINILNDMYSNIDSDKVKEALSFAIEALKCRLPANAVESEIVNGRKVLVCKKCGQLMFVPGEDKIENYWWD